jgi:hypothetical protein
MDIADQCLHDFISEGVRLFGRTFNVFAIHNLVHMTDEVRRHGALFSFSAFVAENYFRPLLEKIKAPYRPFIQLVNRLLEERAMGAENKEREEKKQQEEEQKHPGGFHFKHKRGGNLAVNERYFAAVQFGSGGHSGKGIQFSEKREGDKYLEVQEELRGEKVLSYISCTRFVEKRGADDREVVGRFVEGVRLHVMKEEFFTYPFPASKLGVRLTRERENGHCHRWSLADIRRKLYRMPVPDSDNSVVIPMINKQC